MPAFTWKPFYSELATALLPFKHRQPDLINILAEVKQMSLPVIRLVDAQKPATGPLLSSIDPFTFFAAFNRGITQENRLAILAVIKAKLAIISPLPSDFTGIPVVDNMKSWFFPYAHQRRPDDIENLWALAAAALAAKPEQLDPGLFNSCLEIEMVGPAKLTMGLFWLNPEEYIAVDSHNTSYFSSRGITTQVTDHASYVSLLNQVRTALPQTFPEISHAAWQAKPAPPVPRNSLPDLLRRYHEEHIIFVSSAHNRRYCVDSVDFAGVHVERLDGAEAERITFAHADRAIRRIQTDGPLEFRALDHTAAVRNTILQAEPLALTPDRSHVLFLPDNPSRLSNFQAVLGAMKRENRFYKPAMLLCVLDGIDAGELRENKFSFEWIAPRFISKSLSLGEVVTEREAAQPFYHLSNDLFWLHSVQDRKNLMQSGGDGPFAARTKVRYALFKHTYWDLLQDPACRAAVRHYLERLMIPEPDKLLPAARKALEPTRFVYDAALLRRFIAALAAKPFVILTGTSGTGKTQLAKLIAEWLSQSGMGASNDPFVPGARIASDKVSYFVHRSDKDSVEFWNDDSVESATKVSLPRQMIHEWASEMVAQNFDAETPARRIREAVTSKSKFSSQLHSFETHLKAAALALLATRPAPGQPAGSETYAIVPVGADWTDNRNVVGYVNHLRKDADGNPAYSSTPVLDLLLRATGDNYRPYFLILDEMNLSHVERYFADFLSAMESKKPIPLHTESGNIKTPAGQPVPCNLAFPDNLFVVGTVNVDETTYMFSPKVLDRANVIEFRIAPKEAAEFLGGEPANVAPVQGSYWMALSLLELSRRARGLGVALPAPESVALQECRRSLKDLFQILHQAHLEFAFRTITEVLRYLHVDFALSGNPSNWEWKQCLDAQILQKLLPKLHGSRRRLEAILVALATYCETRNLIASKAVLKSDAELGSYPSAIEPADVALPLSRTKLLEMIEAVRRDQFVSFIQ